MKSIPFLICCLLTLTVSAQKPYSIHGQLKNINDGTIIALYRSDGNLLSPIGSDTLNGGKFKFNGIVGKSEELMIMGVGEGFPTKWLNVWVAPGATINVSGSNKLVKTWEVESPLIEQKELGQFTRLSKVQLDELQKLTIERNDFFRKGIPKDTGERRKVVGRIKIIDQAQDSITTLIHIKEADLLYRLPVTAIWVDKLKEIAQFAHYKNDGKLRESAIMLLKRLDKSQKESESGFEIVAALYPPKVVKKGEVMADTIFSTLAGEKRSLSSYKGKYILLDFWSMGCGPCVESLPEMKLVSENYKDRLTVVSLSVDKKAETWKEASKQHQLTWENLSDGRGMAGIAAKYGVSGIPHYVMISPEGIVLGSWTGYGKGSLESSIKKYLQ